MTELIEKKENLQVSKTKSGWKGTDVVCKLMQQWPRGVMGSYGPVMTRSMGFMPPQGKEVRPQGYGRWRVGTEALPWGRIARSATQGKARLILLNVYHW